MNGVPLYIAERVLISKGLYNLVSEIVGPECVVKSRRQFYVVKDALDNCTAKNENQSVIASGSKVEGFDFKSSDLDLMIVHTNMIVLRDTKFSALYTRKYPTVLVMETDCVPPGFTLLKFLKLDSNDTLVRIGTFTYRRDGCMYMSNNVASRHSIPFHESTVHGPCRTYRTDGGKEIDYAITLRCSQWPEQATSFIQRSSQCGWPPFDILENICNEGCLFVPINSKQRKCSDTSYFEWRISFSVAEKKIIHTMNYCQFLCYGLSKILLKDVLKNSYGDDFLCSYHMKTAVFWEISENINCWTPDNFLLKFWNVLRRVMKWLSLGYCPNFFIPENNMFSGTFRERQIQTLSILQQLHQEGVWCLLKSQSLYEGLRVFMRNPEILCTLQINNDEMVSKSALETWKLDIICQLCCNPADDAYIKDKILCNLLHLERNSNDLIRFAARFNFNYLLQKRADYLFRFLDLSEEGQNRTRYMSIPLAKSILSKTKTFLCMQHIVHAKCMYMNGNYQRTIDLVQHIKHKLQQQQFTYASNLNERIIMHYIAQSVPYETITNTAIVGYVNLGCLSVIDDLLPELYSFAETKCCPYSLGLVIPTFVFLNFLLISSNLKLNMNQERDGSLQELKCLVQLDNGCHINGENKALSWQILGICQQFCGDHQSALQSYFQALNDTNNQFRSATIARILGIYNL